jgi:hypothetical protein
MKIGKKALLVLGAVAIVAALVVVGVLYSRQAGERAALDDRLNRAQALLPVLTASRNSLEDQLASAQSLLEQSLVKFPESVESIEYGEYLFEIAADCNVNLDSLTFPKPAAATLGGVACSVVSLTLPVGGTLENIFKFIDTIRTDDRFASTNVKTINMNIAGSKATVNVDIYGYKR